MIHSDKLSFRLRLHAFFRDRLRDIKLAIKNWNVCPLCYWSGDCNSDCPLCNGNGRLSVAKQIDYLFHKKEYWS